MQPHHRPTRRSVRRIASAASAAIMVAWSVSAKATTYTWVGGASGDPNDYNNAANWNPNGVPGPNDVALFGPTASNQPTLSSSTTSGELDFNTSGWMLGGSANVLTLQGVGGIGILSAATSGINEISANLDVGVYQTWAVATGGTLQIDGQLSNTNTAGLAIGATGYNGTVLLTNANSGFTGGGLVVNTGTLELGGATINGTQQWGTLSGATAITLNSGGTFEINNTTAAGGNASNRLNSPVMGFYGGSFVYVGSDVSGNQSTETLGPVNLNYGPISTITVTLPSSNSSGSAVVNLGTISQYTPNTSSSFAVYEILNGTMLINGVNLGLTGGGTVLTNNTSALNLQGGSAPAAGAESIGVYNQQIVPFLLGESGTGTTQGGTASGTPNTFLTYNGTTGFRPLNPTDEFAHYIDDGSQGNQNPTVNDNIYITTSQSAVLSSNQSINSLVFNGSGAPTLTLPSGQALTDSSGALLFVTSGTITGGTLDFGQSNSANNDVNITVLPGQTATVNSNVTGTGISMNVTGGGTLVFGGSSNTFRNAIGANNATVTFTNGWNPNTTNFYLLNAFDGGTINFNGSSTILAPPGSYNAAHIYMSGGTININGSLTFNNGSANYVSIAMGNGSAINVGNPSGSVQASLINNDQDGFAVGAGFGGVGYFNVYPNSSFTSTYSTATGTGGNAFRFGADSSGSEIMEVYGTASFWQILLADNGTGSVVNSLGAIYLQPNSTFNVTRDNLGTSTANNLFDIGAAGDGNQTNGQANDFGYVSVPAGASIGSGITTTSDEPGELDIAGSSRGSPIYGGNGVMDVIGGTVYIGSYLNLGLSTVNQQFAELNIVNSGNTPGTVTISNAANKGESTVTLSQGTYGSYSVLNVVNSALNNQIGTSSDAYPNNAINLAGTTTYKGTSPMNSSATALQTGILNIVGSKALVQTNYVQSGAISVNGTYGQASSFLNFNGGTLEYNNYSSSTSGQIGFIAQSVGGVYVYSNGAVLSGGVAGASTVAINSGLFAPPGAGIQGASTSTAGTTVLTAGNGLTSGGSGYLAPPVVYITDSTGFDATGYAVMNYTYNAAGEITGGSVASVVITNPGFNLTNPTVTFVGGGGSGASAVIPAGDIVSNAPSGTTPAGGLTVQAGNVTFTFTGNFAGTNASTSALYSFTQNNGTLGVATAGSGLGNNPYASGTYYGNTYPGIKNNTSTYTGPTVLESGTFELITAPGSSSAQSGPFAATNNNIPFSSVIVVGDTGPTMTPNDSAARLNITAIGGAGGFELAPGLINSISYGGNTYTYTSAPQVLAGFGSVIGNSSVGLTIGLATGGVTASTTGTSSNGNNFGGYPYANAANNFSSVSVNNSTVSPGYASNGSVVPITSNGGFYQSSNPLYGNGQSGGGPIVLGQTTSAAPAFSFNSQQGNAAGLPPSNATGALTLGGGNSMTTYLGAGGVYYWKLDMTNGGSGTTAKPGYATNSPGASASSSVPAVGTAWDELLLDNLAAAGTASGSSAFTIQAIGFVSGTTVSGGTPVSYTPGTGSNTVSSGQMAATPYSWVIAQAPTANLAVASLQSLLADLSLNSSGLPAPAPGYQYFLSAQQDPSVSDSDLVINYAPVPEPTALSLLGLGAGASMIRRRRVMSRQ